jgi:hypothetical protein
MLKTQVLPLFLVLSFTSASSQSFYLPVPADWRVETIPFPIEFAPDLPYQGVENLRFAPGWGNTDSEELWSYCFLWWIGADSKISRQSLEKDLESYYGGLVSRNIIRRKIDSKLVVPTVAIFKETSAGKGGERSYAGTISMLDYMSLKPVTLRINVHLIQCVKEGKLGVFFEVSPQPQTHRVWQQFKSVRDGFLCAK